MTQSNFFRFCLLVSAFILAFVFVTSLAWLTLFVVFGLVILILLNSMSLLPHSMSVALTKIRHYLPYKVDSQNLNSTRASTYQSKNKETQNQQIQPKREHNLNDIKDEVRAALEMIGHHQEGAMHVINSLVEQVKVAKQHNQVGFGVHSPSVLITISGPSGTGKTYISELLAKLFYSFDALPSMRSVSLSKSRFNGYEPASVIEHFFGSANGGAIVIDDCDWILEQTGYDNQKTIDSLGPALSEFVEDNPKRFIVVFNGSEEKVDSLFSDSNKKWLRSFHIVRINTQAVSPQTLTSLVKDLLLQKQWSVAEDAALRIEREFAHLERAEKDHFSYAHEARKFADSLIAHKMQSGEVSRKLITEQDVNEVMD
ncbi:AAA family ATPase [Pseudoalteromonas sp. A22]|uniref:AAA family ATPase n=1 Tax=Pseudoalteromonas sp. A22 TaxID=327511 RepID=UPI001BA542B1|nr:AAA family ATPase [Pseudoalteromonas sp. A22]QUI63118.1 AAA family ATPase [Pseudoalteromonas sp. A22]